MRRLGKLFSCWVFHTLILVDVLGFSFSYISFYVYYYIFKR